MSSAAWTVLWLSDGAWSSTAIAALRRRARGCLLVAESRSVRVHAPPRAEGLVRGEAVSQ